MEESWVRKQWLNIDLGDLRLNRRAIKIAVACAKQPKASLPQRFDSLADIKAAYRLFDHPSSTHQTIQTPHYQNVIKTAKKSPDPILFIQDGSEILFNSHLYTNLGPTADACGNGMMFHSCLVASFNQKEETEVIGLGFQKVWVRPEAGEKKKDKNSKESEIWLETLQKIGSPPEGKQWISVGDRGNDIFEFLKEADKVGWGFVVRAKHNRHIKVNGKSERLHSWVRSLTGKESTPIYLRTRGENLSEEVQLQLAWGKATIDSSTTEDKNPCEFTYLRVFSPNNSKIEWVLVTNLPIENEEDALRVVNIYRKRWLIEEYHKALKTGCRIEDSQMRQASRIQALLGFLGIIATRLLSFKENSRLHPMELASKTIPKEMTKLICRYFKVPAKELRLRDFWRYVARMGGFLARKSDGEPGWQTIWRGYTRLQDMILGGELLASQVKNQ